MKLISYYCDIDNRTFYSDHAKRLTARCNELGIDCDIRERFPAKSPGNEWLKAEAIKRGFKIGVEFGLTL